MSAIALREEVAAKLATVQTEVNFLAKNNSLVSSLAAANAMYLLDQILTDQVVKAFYIPLMNTRAGFLTDRDPARAKRGQTPPVPYSVAQVRACLKDAILKGLLPIGNQFNIIAGNVYITREGYTYLLSRMGVKHRIIPSQLADRDGYAVYSCRIEALTAQKERISYTNEVLFKRGQYDSDALLQGKAYARSVKSLYTYVSGLDAGDAVEDNTGVEERVIEDQTADQVETVAPVEPVAQPVAEPIPAGRKVAKPVAEPVPAAAPSQAPTVSKTEVKSAEPEFPF